MNSSYPQHNTLFFKTRIWLQNLLLEFSIFKDLHFTYLDLMIRNWQALGPAFHTPFFEMQNFMKHDF